jgi:hypothetical protein
MYDGTIKPVQDVVVGDQVIGPDSLPRSVILLGRGRETMYEVCPTKGDSFFCNENHILSLKYSGSGCIEERVRADGSIYTKPPRYGGQEYIDVSVKEFLTWSKRKQSRYLIYRSGAVDFPQAKGPKLFNPYTLGLWLGDGTSCRFEITNIDQEIIEYLQHTEGMIKILPKGRPPLLRDSTRKVDLKVSNLLNNKHIPIQYKTSSQEERLELLAGLLDSDGTLRGNCFHIIQKSKALAEDIAFLARSLGLAAYITERTSSCVYKGEKREGIYHMVGISGDLDKIPTKLPRKQATPRKQRKSALVTGFTLNKLPEEDYYGFTLLEDPHFLLGDFTVTHNTFGAIKRILDVCHTTPGTVAYMGAMDFQVLKRNTWKIIRETFTVTEAWDHPAIKNSLHNQCNELSFTNGSSLTCINLEKHLDKKIGYSAGIQLIDEVHLLPNEDAYKLIVGRTRGTPPEIRQLMMCTNPEKTKKGWINQFFELEKFDGVDTSEKPYEMLVGPRCACQFCTKCKLFRSKEISWEQTGEEEWRCPSCGSFRDFYTWKGKKYFCPGNEQYIRVIKSESGHNPHLPDDYFQGMKDAYDDNYFDIMVRGQLNTDLRDDYLYKKYVPEVHEISLPINIDYKKDFYWGLDFNRKPQSSVVAQFEEIDGDERFLFKDEICLFGKPTLDYPYGKGEGAIAIDVAREFVRRYKKDYQGTVVHIYGDPAGWRKSQTSNEVSFEIIAQHLEENGFEVDLVADDAQISIKDRLECVEFWLEDGLLRFNPQYVIPWTTKSFADSETEEGDYEGRKPSKKEDENAARATNRKKIYCVSHFNEAAGYMVIKLFPLSAQELRSATLPDGTTITENRKGEVQVQEAGAPSKPVDEYEEYYQKKLNELKAAKTNSVGAQLNLSIPRIIIRD